MKLLFLLGRELAYPRNSILAKAFESQDVELVYCTSLYNSYPARFADAFFKFLVKISNNCDAVFIGFLGHPFVPIISKFIKKPILFDAFISVYDTLCFDRKVFSPHSLLGKLSFYLDKKSCNASNIVLLDTSIHIDYFSDTFSIGKDKFRRILVGADDTIFFPRRSAPKDDFFHVLYYGEFNPLHGIEYIVKASAPKDDFFHVLYYGEFNPLHGIEYIVKAAAILEKENKIKFTIIGKGREHARIMNLAENLGTSNIEFINWVPYKSLPDIIAQSDLCLGGHFGDSLKSKRVIAGKTYQMMAMQKALILGKNDANKELFSDGDNVLMVNHSNEKELADAILKLKNDDNLRNKIALNAYNMFKNQCSISEIGRQIRSVLNELL
jgi:glycosyltransferase involved in cell wall biosynthesis